MFGSIRWRSKTENIDHLRVQGHPDRVRSARPLLGAHAARDRQPDPRRSTWPPRASSTRRGRPRRRRSPPTSSSQVNLLEACAASRCRRASSSSASSEEYGLVDEDELPIKETNPLRPLSPYAVSKVAQDLMGYQYFKSYGLPIVRTPRLQPRGARGAATCSSRRTSPGRSPRSRPGLREPVIYVGDLKPTRDYSDVRDIVRGYWLLLERGEPGEVYNLCSGHVVGDPAGARLPARAVARVKDIEVQVGSGAPAPVRRDGPRGDPRRSRRRPAGRPRSPSSTRSRTCSTTGGSGPGRRRADAAGTGRSMAAAARRAGASEAPRVALVHDWLTGMRGGERCLEVFCELFPDRRPLHAAARARLRVAPSSSAGASSPRSSSGCRRPQRALPPLPAALSRRDARLRSAAATTSCSPPATRWPRACACPRARSTSATASPRCATCGTSTTTTSARAPAWPRAVLMPPVAAALRRWDRRDRGGRPPLRGDLALRGRPHPARLRADADVIYPPVDVARFRVDEAPGDFYLVVSALDPVQARGPGGGGGQPARPAPRGRGHRPRGGAAARHGRAHRGAPRAGATTPRPRELYARCRALLFPPLEDFGITPLEAMAAGRPVIAFGAGRRAGDGGAARRGGAADRALLRAPDGRRSWSTPSGASRPPRTGSSPRPCAARAEAFDRPLFRERMHALPAGAAGGARPAC